MVGALGLYTDEVFLFLWLSRPPPQKSLLKCADSTLTSILVISSTQLIPLLYRVPTGSGKTGNLRRPFPVNEKSGKMTILVNFWISQRKSFGVKENPSIFWRSQAKIENILEKSGKIERKGQGKSCKKAKKKNSYFMELV